VRTRPGAPGEVPSFGNGGRGGQQTGSGGASGLDGGGGTGGVDGGAKGGAGGRDASGSGGRSDGGGGDGGSARDARVVEPSACPVDITFGCHDYCGALSLVSDCREKLRKSAGVKEDGGAFFSDGAVPHLLTTVEMIERCKCDCERHLRTPTCRFEFDQFIMCAVPPLTVVCATDPALIDEVPSVIGPCGSARSSFVKCLETPLPPPLDGGPS
jgi:hypothetical protein